ncbi:MAG TPA: hypothetical protein VH419_05435 [Nocardioidaceae bacterium]
MSGTDSGTGATVSGKDGTNEADGVDALLPHAAESESTSAASAPVPTMRGACPRP